MLECMKEPTSECQGQLECVCERKLERLGDSKGSSMESAQYQHPESSKVVTHLLWGQPELLRQRKRGGGHKNLSQTQQRVEQEWAKATVPVTPAPGPSSQVKRSRRHLGG